MIATQSIPPRPPIAQQCSCVWRALEEMREREAQHRQEEAEKTASTHSALETVKSTLSPLMPGAFKSTDAADSDKRVDAEDLPPVSPPRGESQNANLGVASERKGSHDTVANAGLDRSPVYVDPRLGTVRKETQDPAAAAKRIDRKAELLKKKGWVAKGKPTTWFFGKTEGDKLADLLSYREDLVHLLETLIPSRRRHDPHATHPPVVTPVPHTPLCVACQQSLAYGLYYTPPARDKFLRKSCTAAFLSLIDDATASLSGSLPMEYLTHHQLDSILRRELAVVEWRVAVKLARYHKQTGFLKEFPVRIGEYGEFQVNVKPPSAPEGIVKRTGKKIMSAVGLGTSEGPSGKVQGPSDDE
ncbi:hypothetical protein HDU85_002053 [Gaertneriomyces sp. JEL0708]|nr:hypothetical protein HDU85_002053 [Gaertneriomyces sp. JEL0708]